MTKFIKYGVMSVLVSSLLIATHGCSSGGGGDGGSVTSPFQSISNGGATVSGSIATAASGIVSSSAFKATAAAPSSDSSASARLVVDLNTNGEYGDSGDAILTSEIGSDGSFDFGEIKVNETGETKAELTVAKQGFAPYTKIITLSDGKNVSVIADAASTPLLTEAVDITSYRASGTLSSSFLEIGTKRTGEGLTSYSVIRSLSEMKVLSDVPLDGDTQTKSIIPLGALEDSVKSIKAETQSFDPTDPEDAEKFPGEYVGVGEPGQGEQRLVSVGFDYMALTDQNGDPVELDLNRLNASSKLLPQAVDYSSCLRTSIRYLNGAQLDLFKKYGDDDTTTEEFEIPLWFYNSSTGNWQYLGQAEVFEDRALTVDYNASSSATIAYAHMCITENWGTSVNLDYSFAPEEPLNVCVIAKDQDDLPISNLYVSAKKDTASDSHYLDRDGKTKLALLSDRNVSAYTFSYQGTLTGWNSTEVQGANIISGGETGCDHTINIEVVNPYSATLKVTVKELDGSLAVNQYIRVYNSDRNDYFHKTAYTDVNGQAEFKVKPSTNYGVTYRGTTKDVNVNGTTLAPESADNGRIATVVVQEEEQAPEVSIYIYSNSISDSAESVNFHVSATDGNKEAITLTSLKLNNVTLQAGADYEITSQYSYVGYDSFTAKLNLNAATVSVITPQSLQQGTYSLEASYSDGKAPDGKNSQQFTVNPNRAPVISSVYLYSDLKGWTYINSTIESGTYDISAYAYDADADAITLTYTLDTVDIGDAKSVSLVDGTHTLVISASDASETTSKTFEFFVGNNAPVITSFGATSYSVDLASSDTTIKLYAYAQDRDGDTLSVQTTDGAVSFMASYTGSNYFTSTDITIDANKTFVIYANDTDKNSTVASLDVTTYRANQAPVFDTELTSISLAVGTSHTFTCQATDPEQDTVSYEWLVGDVVQSSTSTTFTYTFNTSAIVTCRATDADTLELQTAVSSAQVTVYNPNASGNLVVITLPGAIVATHNTDTLALTETKTAGDDGKATFAVAGTDRVTFSVSVGPDVGINEDVLFKANLSELSYELNYICEDTSSDEGIPAACALYNADTFLSLTSMPVSLVNLYLEEIGESDQNASDADTNNNNFIDSAELYAAILNDEDANSDGVLTWGEYRSNGDVNSEFYVNAPVGEYDIELSAYSSQMHEGHADYTYAPTQIDFSGFIEDTVIYISYQSVVVGLDGNASLINDYLFDNYDGTGLYSYIAKYIDDNNITKYLLELDKTAAQVASLSYTPASFTLNATEVALTNNTNGNMYVRANYKNHYLETLGESGRMLNDSRLTYGLSTYESINNQVTGVNGYKQTYNYYADATLQSSYDIADFPHLNIESTFNPDRSVNFSGSDLSKVTFSSIRYTGYGSAGNTYVGFNFTVMPSTVAMPDLASVLPSAIATSLPTSYNDERVTANITEYKDMNEADLIDTIESGTNSFDTIGMRSISLNVTLNQSVTPSSVIDTESRVSYTKPFSIGFEPRTQIAK